MNIKPGNLVEIKLNNSTIEYLDSTEGSFVKVKVLATRLYSRRVLLCLKGLNINESIYSKLNWTKQAETEETEVITNITDYNGTSCVWLDLLKIREVIALDGSTCKKCKDYCRMAQPNQEDGSFICFSCRNNPWR